jgi:hypothetical protein
MQGQHFLPAAYIGMFSDDLGGRRRRRAVWVLRRGAKSKPESAETLARVNDLYEETVARDRPFNLERNWTTYESQLPDAIQQLTEADVDARTWLHVLVPFVAGMLVRGPEFAARFEARIGDAPEGVDEDNTLGGRVFELQRLLAPVMACRWVVVASPNREIVGNDIGWMHATGPEPPTAPGVAIALGRHHVLHLISQAARPILYRRDGSWMALVERSQMDAAEADSFNRCVAHNAERLIFGSAEWIVGRYGAELRKGHPPAEGPISGLRLDPRILVAHEFEWHRLAAALARGMPETETFPVDFASLPQEWYVPIVILPTNLPEFPTGLRLMGNLLWLLLFGVDGFTDPPYWEGFGRADRREDFRSS